MNVGDVCDGVVTRLEHFGMFVDVDGVPGLLRVVDLTWARISHPSDIAAVGDTVRFQILQLHDPAKRPQERFSGSIKVLLPKPDCADGDTAP
ncbi:30S ribosomal protein S1 [Rubripirellula tenax]|uniref:30S ribosomal protein S1 n=1 Tax=Rubripirellula tenax TaxID=2528015 RepID=A0A5C6EQ21_9BACT|nr:30S ribosomal protein S1 [Rubripirellula tenax]